jgi:Flp pilus assembly CpaF family ATPase
MISAQHVQERRLDELLKRQLGPTILAAIADPQVTEIIVNEDGRLWFESYGQECARRDSPSRRARWRV